MDPVANSFFRSAGAATLSQIWRVGVTLLTHLALRRFIPPEQMGVWNWAEPLFLLLAQIRDLGTPGQLVRMRDRPYGNFFWLQVVWGGLLAALVFVSAPELARLYQDPSAPTVAVIRALCLFLFVQGLGATPLVFFESEIKVEKTIAAELARNFVFAGLSLSLAVLGWGVWSPILGHIAGAAVYSGWLWWAAWPDLRGRLRLVPGLRRLIVLSLPLMVMALLEQSVLKLDTFILALRFDSAIVGIAGLALFAVFFFARLVSDSVGRALYPALVRFHDDGARAFEAFRIATVMMASFVVPLAFGLLVNAEVAALILGGEKWAGAATYLRWLALVPLVRPLAMFGLEFLLTRHRDRLLLGYTLSNLVSLAALAWFLTGTSLGPLGMALAGYFPLGNLLLTWGVWRESPSGFKLLSTQLLELDLLGAVLFLPIFFAVAPIWPRFAVSLLAALLFLAYAWRRHAESGRRFLRGTP